MVHIRRIVYTLDGDRDDSLTFFTVSILNLVGEGDDARLTQCERLEGTRRVKSESPVQVVRQLSSGRIGERNRECRIEIVLRVGVGSIPVVLQNLDEQCCVFIRLNGVV